MQQDKETWLAHAQGIWKAQLYIQKHLDEELNLHQIAKTAHFSPYHFHRIFKAFTGESLNNYIRRLRIEKAAGRLKYTHHCVTDIALDSGYQTPSSFSKAFQKVMGASPLMYRASSAVSLMEIKKTPPYKEKAMKDPEIIQMQDQSVLFVRKVGPYQDTPHKAWETLLTFAKQHHLNLADARMFSIGLDDPAITVQEKLRFDACITAPDSVKEQGEIGRQTIKGGKYAVFLHQGPYDTLEESFDAIFTQWYPSHKDEVAELPCFCEHLNPELRETHPEKLLSKIYVPLK